MRREFRIDRTRFSTHGCADRRFTNLDSQLAFIRMLEHSIEKGLSLPAPRPAFGERKVRQLCDNIEACSRSHGWRPEFESALSSLEEYLEFNRSSGSSNGDIEARVSTIRALRVGTAENPVKAGTHRLKRDSIIAVARRELQEFFQSRHSVRNFSDEEVDLEQIAHAVRMAQQSPSVCNRQSARVHVFANDETGRTVLSCQSGNAGFGHTANKILVITSDLRCFLSIGERNQCWIDGGMFAMSLIYALHSLGLATCCLNWSVEHAADARLRSVADIPAHENIIMLIAVGHFPKELSVAASCRLPLEQVLRVRRSRKTEPAAVSGADKTTRVPASAAAASQE